MTAIPDNDGDPVERQVDAYNAGNVEAFLSCYAPDALIEDATGTVVMHGHDAMRAAYSELFRASPDLHADIATRICIGEYAVHEELVTGHRGLAEELRVVAVYHVANGLIDRVRIIR